MIPLSSQERELKERELRKKKLRAQWEVLRTAPTQTVIPHSAPDPAAVEFLIRDPDDIRPARPISHNDVEEINNRFWRLLHLPSEEQLEETFEIGFWLRCWHDLFASESSWIKWREANLTMPLEEISRCMWLWDNNEKIRSANRRKEQALNK